VWSVACVVRSQAMTYIGYVLTGLT
jgi:hypothetical protein